ncbi:MAG: hypothetical protein HQ523_05570 [Lentisphaerae bacterium]|nr:hypothetical protein [Lentisphaerota bacterium]
MCALKKDTEGVDWSRRYVMALRRFLQQGPSASLRSAARLGRRAVTLGLETLDVAKSHEQALTALAPPGPSSESGRHKSAERAKRFFTEAIVPIEATHRASLKAEARIDQLTRTLRRRRNESSASATRLREAIPQREAAEVILKQGEHQHAELLAEAHGLQKDLQRQMREHMAAQEHERKNTSQALRNEIAQALLAIDLRLLALRTSASADTERLENEIVNAQRLVEQLGKSDHI